MGSELRCTLIECLGEFSFPLHLHLLCVICVFVVGVDLVDEFVIRPI